MLFRSDAAYFGTEGGKFFAVDWKAGSVLWTYQADGNPQYRSSPAVTDGCVVFGGRNKRVTALNPKTGEVKWEFTARSRIDSSPVVVGSRVYVGGADGRIYGLSLETGKQEFLFEGGGGFSSSPAVAGGKLIIANDRGVLFCLGEKTGS